MIGIAICSHADLASGLKNAVEMIAGAQEDFYAFEFHGDIELMEFGNILKEETNQSKEGCIYVVDLLNATPFNAALVAIAYSDDVIITGASLPLVLELIINRANNPDFDIYKLSHSIMDSTETYVTIRTSSDVF
jgi:Phosphotransferase system, mannose/fructose-specific component IIA